jgi:hypothetical protein
MRRLAPKEMCVDVDDGQPRALVHRQEPAVALPGLLGE